MISPNFVFVALCFNVLGTSFYLRKSLKGEVRPHLVTFTLWTLAPLLSFAAQTTEGVGPVSFLTLVAGLNPALILLAALRKRDAHWAVTRFDIGCGCLSLAGILTWWILRNASYAIAFSIAADALASIPTFHKSIRNPESESPVLYVCSAISAIITVFTIHHWSFDYYGFVVYLLVADSSLALIGLNASWVRRSAGNCRGQRPGPGRPEPTRRTG